ncbi:MAG: CDP-alcohol phosphatidyltransferase family protein, partial [Candidatus Gastranaerophilales bacterium]|nr:CDP-alcohol phosphatidyltransferase family protein [Candidatus Gastranaerophilales bacterium]
MISVYQLKKRFQDILRPISENLVKIGVTANMVTISAFILSVITGAVVYFFVPKCNYVYWILPVSLFIRMALNAIDGMLAREHNQKSNLGAVFNELGDILSDVVIYVPLLYVCGCCFWLIFLFIVLTIISETVGIMGIQINASRHYEGPMGKSDRAFWLSILAIVLVFVQLSPKIIDIFIGILSLLLVYTIFNRIKGALK